MTAKSLELSYTPVIAAPKFSMDDPLRKSRRLADVKRGVENFKRLEELAEKHWRSFEVNLPDVSVRNATLKPLSIPRDSTSSSPKNNLVSTVKTKNTSKPWHFDFKAETKSSQDNVNSVQPRRRSETENGLSVTQETGVCVSPERSKYNVVDLGVILDGKRFQHASKGVEDPNDVSGWLPKLTLSTTTGVRRYRPPKKEKIKSLKDTPSRHLNFYYSLREAQVRRSWKPKKLLPKPQAGFRPVFQSNNGRLDVLYPIKLPKKSHRVTREPTKQYQTGVPTFHWRSKEKTNVVLNRVHKLLQPFDKGLHETPSLEGLSVRELPPSQTPNVTELMEELEGLPVYNPQSATGTGSEHPMRSVYPLSRVESCYDSDWDMSGLPQFPMDNKKKCNLWLENTVYQ